MKILFVSTTPPWPESHGARRRLAAQLEALNGLGHVTLVAPVTEPPPISGMSVRGFDVGPWISRRRLRYSWIVHPRLPFRVLPPDTTLKESLRSLAHDHYDLIWVHRLELWGTIRHRLPRTGRLIIDADDLAVDAMHQIARRPGRRSHLRLLRDLYVNEEIRRWDALLASGLRAGLVGFSNPRHVERLKHPNVVLIRNAMRPLGPYTTHRFQHPSRTVGFVGFLRYPPNHHAAMRLADGLAAALKSAVPGTCVRVIGEASSEMRERLRKGGVETTGYVEDLYSEMNRLDALIIPVTAGSGTRVKALDAMAVGLPIISTSFGVDGIGLIDGSSVLIGESDDDLASAWSSLSRDQDLARGLAAAAHAEYLASHSFDALLSDIRACLDREGHAT